jgi:hypothetical protein
MIAGYYRINNVMHMEMVNGSVNDHFHLHDHFSDHY